MVMVPSIQDGPNLNGMKLTSELWLYPLLTSFLPGCAHEREALGAPLLDPRLHPIGAYGDHDHRHSWPARTWRAEPSQGSHTADPFHPHMLEPG
jgi:hypothetical protein